MPLPVRALHLEQPALEVHVAPLQRDHLAHAEARVTAEQHHELRRRSELLGGLRQSLVVLYLVEVDGTVRRLEVLDLHRNPVDDLPLHRDLQHRRERGEAVVHRLHAAVLKGRLELLHVLVREGVQPLLPEPGQQVVAEV
ncbi:hypothetical protein NR798_17445 [Archangium gephyra]